MENRGSQRMSGSGAALAIPAQPRQQVLGCVGPAGLEAELGPEASYWIPTQRHRQRPRDPRPLRWPDEPGFSAAVSSVLENRATEVDINIRSNRTHAIDGALGLQLKDFGFELGGGAQHSGATSLHIRASFPQGRKGWR
jgi:hypothetical protein